MKLTSANKKKIVNGLFQVFKKHKVVDDVVFYFDNQRATVDRITGKLKVQKGFNVRDYMKYCNENTVSVSFDGPLFEIMNGYASENLSEAIDKEIERVLAPYGLFYELGNDWNFSLYDIDSSDNQPAKRPEPIRIDREGNVPRELLAVSMWWKDQADSYGDSGCCVLGAGFTFEYQGKKYFMPPLSRWQGSCSWEAFIQPVREKLESLGAVKIEYEYGNMD